MSHRTQSRPRRGLNLIEASLYVGVSSPTFTMLLDTGRMPQPRLIDGIRVWDIEELDIYFAALPRDERTGAQRQQARKRDANGRLPAVDPPQVRSG